MLRAKRENGDEKGKVRGWVTLRAKRENRDEKGKVRG